MELTLKKICQTCLISKNFSEFYLAPKHQLLRAGQDKAYYLRSDCKICFLKANRDKYKEAPEKVRERHYKKNYNWSIADYDQMFKAQGGLCAICRGPQKQKNHWVKDRDEQNPLAIDHCHKTGKIRGLLCFSCNIILGHVEEKQNRLQNLIDYLQKHG